MLPSIARFYAYLLGHSHEAGEADAAGVVPSGYLGAGLREPDLCRRAIEVAIRQRGTVPPEPPFMLPDAVASNGDRMPYWEQMAEAEKMVADRVSSGVYGPIAHWQLLIIHVHCDMGAHRDRLILYDKRSRIGEEAAMKFAGIASSPPIQNNRVFAAIPDKNPKQANPDDWLARAYNCITGAWPLEHTAAVLVEIGNLKSKQHAPLWTENGLAETGRWLNAAAETWVSGG